MTRIRCAPTHLVGDSLSTLALRRQIEAVAPRTATVLLEGETGVGKEVAARELHACSRRAAGAFVPVDCTAFSTELMESQLFGHERGAFTGAVSASLGFVRCADGGTLFLDEIGELPPPIQAKLLRCLQERSVVPVGADRAVPVDVRVIAATHRDLAAMVRSGQFRQDLYFRLNVVRLAIVPLRRRREGMLTRAEPVLDGIAAAYEEPPKRLPAATADALLRHDWPGNVRELRNAIERAFLFCGDRTIEPAHLPPELALAGVAAAEAPLAVGDDGAWLTPQRAATAGIPRLADAERALIARALEATGGNQTDAARLLDIERHRLRRKIALYGLEHLLRLRPR